LGGLLAVSSRRLMLSEQLSYETLAKLRTKPFLFEPATDKDDFILAELPYFPRAARTAIKKHMNTLKDKASIF
jgi:hypothetical protein